MLTKHPATRRKRAMTLALCSTVIMRCFPGNYTHSPWIPQICPASPRRKDAASALNLLIRLLLTFFRFFSFKKRSPGRSAASVWGGAQGLTYMSTILARYPGARQRRGISRNPRLIRITRTRAPNQGARPRMNDRGRRIGRGNGEPFNFHADCFIFEWPNGKKWFFFFSGFRRPPGRAPGAAITRRDDGIN